MFNRFSSILPGLLLLCPLGSHAAGLSVTPAEAIPPAESVDYQVNYLHVPFGNAHATWEESASNYTASLSLKTTDVGAVFKPQALTVTVSGKKMKDGAKWRYLPTVYHFTNDRPNKKKDLTARYDREGRITGITLTPPDADKDRKPVDSARRDGASDPLTAFMALAENALFGSPSGNLQMFDGSRLYYLQLSALEKGDDPNEKHYRITRTPLEGFTDKELKRAVDTGPVEVWIKPHESRFPDRLSLAEITAVRKK